MKFKVISYTQRLGIFDTVIGEYTIKSLCGKYTRTIGHNEYENSIKSGYISSYGAPALLRVTSRLAKLGINLEFTGNVPWVYLDSVNGIPVREVKNARHGYCVDYITDKSHLNFRKDLFSKIRELTGKVKL